MLRSLALTLLVLAGGLVARQAAPREVSFPAPDGGVVYALEYGEGPRAVVLGHGGRFTKESWSEQAPVLQEAGFRVLAIDFRGRGKSRGGPGEGASDRGAHFDILAAVAYLQSTGAESISVVGASFGGWAAARAAAESPGEIDRLVLLASPADQPEKLTGRKLFILTRDDTSGTGRRLPRIQAQFERAPEPKELVILPGSAHAQFIFETEQAQRLMAEIVRFLSAP